MNRYFERFKFIKILALIILLGVTLDVAIGAYMYSDGQQRCSKHMLYNIPGRGRLTDNPYSTQELEAIQLDCHANGLKQQADTVFLPFNKTRIERRLASTRTECEAIPGYQFSWGCQLPYDVSG